MEDNRTLKHDNLTGNEMPEIVPAASVSELKKKIEILDLLGREILKADIDFGVMQGKQKPSLLKPGAEKIRIAFNLIVESIDCIKETIDMEKGFIDYTYKCIITSDSGKKLGICDGNANSFEEKYRYVFKPAVKVPARKDIEILKIEGRGKWKKYGSKWIWMERAENKDVISLKNTIQKIAQKRAFVGAILMASGASEFFSQDVSVN